MKKSEFVNLVLGVIGGLLFAVGMCMCLLPEWNAFKPGVVVTAIGGVILLILLGIWLKKRGGVKKPNWKLVGKIAFGVLAALILGLGMCMILVWNLMIYGIIVGIIGILLLLCLIPMFVGLKD